MRKGDDSIVPLKIFYFETGTATYSNIFMKHDKDDACLVFIGV